MYWAPDYFGGRNPSPDFMDCTNILFSNGVLDAWSTGGMLYNATESWGCKSLILPDSAHHFDLRFPNKDKDPVEVVKYRDLEKAYFDQILKDYQASLTELQ